MNGLPSPRRDNQKIMQNNNLWVYEQALVLWIKNCEADQFGSSILHQIQYYFTRQQKLSHMQSRKTGGSSDAPNNSLSHRTSLRFSTLNTETFTGGLFRSENNSPLADSFRERLPKFKTQESSPVGKKKGSAGRFHFPELGVRQNNPSQYTLHSLNVEQIKNKGAKASFFLDSIIRIFKEGEQPKPPLRDSKKPQAEEFNEFLEPGKERRSKRPKIIQNEMTRIFLSSKEKERKAKANAINNALSEKIGSVSFRNNYNASRLANEFLPEGKEELNKLRTLRFSKK